MILLGENTDGLIALELLKTCREHFKLEKNDFKGGV